MGCCGAAYEEDVEKQIFKYINTLNQPDSIKRQLTKEIKDDLKKTYLNDQNNNLSKKENVEKTVKFYKSYIDLRIKNIDELHKIEEKEFKKENKESENKNIQKENDNNTNEIFENDNNIEIKNKNLIIDPNEQVLLNSNDVDSIDSEILLEKNIDKEDLKSEEKQEIKESQKEKEEEIENDIIENKKDIKIQGEDIKVKEDETKINVIKQVKDENTEKEMVEYKKENQINWRELMEDDKNFSQEIPFDFKAITYKLKKASETPEKLNPFYTISAIFDFTKFFKEISSALSMGFSDITEKCGIMRQRFASYPEATDIQNLLQIEMNLNLHKLNKDNNKKLGHGKDIYKDYISACRTFLRLLWFLEYLTDVFENVLEDDGSGPIKKILGNSYDKVLAPHHSFFVKKAVGIALKFSSAGNVAKNVDIIFGYKEYNEEARKAIKNTVNLMKIIWKGGHDFYEKNDLLNLA